MRTKTHWILAGVAAFSFVGLLFLNSLASVIIAAGLIILPCAKAN